MNLTLTQEQYLALVSLARQGSDTPDQKRVLDTFLKDIEQSNGLNRYLLLVQWQEMDAPLSPATNFPEVWPPEFRAQIERTDRPIARADVDALVKKKASNPTNVMVTKDPGGIVGWTKVEDFFIT